ncbi:MAG: hypothetical protein AAF552_17260, partial [Pseudomonadota bacterium]
AKSSDYDQALPKFSLGEMIRWNIDLLCNTAFILNEVCQLRLVSRYFRVRAGNRAALWEPLLLAALTGAESPAAAIQPPS